MVTVCPAFINVVVPSHGPSPNPETITITNPSDRRLAFKIRGTKLDLFDVDPSYAFLPAKSCAKSKILPKKFDGTGLSRHDHFTVLLTFAPEGENDVKKVWQKATMTKKYIIRIAYIPGIDRAQPNKGTKAEEVPRGSEEMVSYSDETKNSGKPCPQGIKKSERNLPKIKPTPVANPDDDEKTEPPEDLVELPEFLEFYYRHYD